MQQYEKHVQSLIKKHMRDAEILAGAVEQKHSSLPPTCELMTCVSSLFNSTDPEVRRVDGLMKWQSDAIAAERGVKPRGIFIPWEVFSRDLNSASQSAGGALVADTHVGEVLSPLRAHSVALAVGAVVLTEMTGGQAILPAFDADIQVSWVDVNTTPPDEVPAGDPSFNKVILVPRTLAATVTVSSMLVRDGARNPGFEIVLRREILKALMAELDRVILSGSGSSVEPGGILLNADVPSVPIGENGGIPTWDLLAQMEDTSKAEHGKGVFVTNSAVRKKLRTTVRGSGLDYVWTGADLLGKPAFVTDSIPGNLTKGTGTNLSGMIFGDFSNVFVGLWGSSVLDIVINPYTKGPGKVEITAFLDVGIGIRHGAAFARCTDIVTT